MDETHISVPNTLVAELTRVIESSLTPEVCPDGTFRLRLEKALVERVRGLKFEIYAKEHPPPHFHVETSDGRASFALDDGRLIKQSGNIRNLEQQVAYYFSENKLKLIQFWNDMRPDGCPVGLVALPSE